MSAVLVVGVPARGGEWVELQIETYVVERFQDYLDVRLHQSNKNKAGKVSGSSVSNFDQRLITDR